MRVLSVVGCRPQFVKLAPVHRALSAHEHVIVHTGQHYDDTMSRDVLEDLGLPQPDVNLEVGSGSHGDQTGRMLPALERTLQYYRPDWVLVYGDTNTTLAGALAAVKLHLRVAHVEAGLRSFNRRMPEEHNRVLTDHCADLLLAPTQTAVDNLTREGLSSVLVGDVHHDALQMVPLVLGRDDYLVATIHRPDNCERLSEILAALRALPLPVTLVAHPRIRGLDAAGLDVVEPLPFRRMVNLIARSRGVITDSGGLQKEAFLLRVPCTTLRAETEWPETLIYEWNVLCPDLADLAKAVSRSAENLPLAPTVFGWGAAQRIVEALT